MGKKETGCKPDCKIFELEYIFYSLIYSVELYVRYIFFVILTRINGNWRKMSMTTSPDLTPQIVHEDLFATPPPDEKKHLH